jgi:hypothetical protein
VTRRLLYGGFAVLGLALYLWPALAAPVVRWSDSELDLDWARRGVGIFSPVVSPHHPPKPGYILFLRAVIAPGPAETEARCVVVIQSLLLWLSIGATALLVGHRVGARSGVELYVALAELGSAVRRIGGVAVLALLVAAVAWQRQALDRGWGRIESSGVRIGQTIPRGALPGKEPATLHVRVAPLLVPTKATLGVLGPSIERLWTGPFEGPFLTIAMPHALLVANRLGPIELAFVADGDYDSAHFLVFPVIPRPWASPAFRTGSESLSPSSGVPFGSLDWWSHKGAP